MKTVKTITVNTLIILSLVSLSLIMGCKGGDDPVPLTEEQKLTTLLTAGNGTWTPPTVGGVLVEGDDVTADLFEGFSIKFFADGTLTTTGTSPVWERTDTWSFKDETATIMLRGQDDKQIQFQKVSDTEVKLTLEWDQTTTGGRSKSIEGTHVFILKK